MDAPLISTLIQEDVTSGSVEVNVLIGTVITKLHDIANYLIRIGEFDEAIACFKVLSLGDDSFENGDYAYGIGRAREGKGDLIQSLAWFRVAYENNPPMPQFEAGIARVMAKLRQSGAAADFDYRLGDYAFSRGMAHEKAGDVKKALHWYAIACGHNPAIGEFTDALARLTSRT